MAGQGVFLDGEAGVSFTIYRLQKELQDNGHSYNRQQIKDALNVLTRTTLELKSESGSVEFTFHPIEAIGFNGEDEETQTFVKFSPLVTKSIKDRTFRLFNYEKVMSYKSVIARQLHKRMAHHYTQASLTDPYTILLTTIIRDFGITRYKQIKDNLREVETAIEEMKSKNPIIISYIWSRIVCRFCKIRHDLSICSSIGLIYTDLFSLFCCHSPQSPFFYFPARFFSSHGNFHINKRLEGINRIFCIWHENCSMAFVGSRTPIGASIGLEEV